MIDNSVVKAIEAPTSDDGYNETDDDSRGEPEQTLIGQPTSLVTPWYRPLANATITQCDEEPQPNYTPYDLFCLHTRLQSVFARRYPELANATILFPMIPSFDPNGVTGMMRVVVQLQTNVVLGASSIQTVNPNQATSLLLAPDLRQRLQAEINQILATWPRHCVLDDAQVITGSTKIPRSWLRVVLPYLRLDPKLDPFILEECLMVDLSSIFDYHTVYDQLTILLRNTLERLYQHGTVVCSAAFAERWQLVPIAVAPLPLTAESLDEERDVDEDPGVHLDDDSALVTESIPLRLPPGWNTNNRFIRDDDVIDVQVQPTGWSQQDDQPVYTIMDPDDVDDNIGVQDDTQIVSGMDVTLDDYLEDRQQETTVGLYQASKGAYGDRLIRNKTRFLLDRLHRVTWIRLNPSGNATPPERELEIWHHAARAIQRFHTLDPNNDRFIFAGCGLLVHQALVPNLDTFRRLAQVLSLAWLEGLVSDPVDVQRLTALPEGRLPENAVVYRTVDRIRPWVVSSLIRSNPVSNPLYIANQGTWVVQRFDGLARIIDQLRTLTTVLVDTDRQDGLVRIRVYPRDFVPNPGLQAIETLNRLSYVPLRFSLNVDTPAVDRARTGQDDWLVALRKITQEFTRRWVEPSVTTIITSFPQLDDQSSGVGSLGLSEITTIVFEPINDDGLIYVPRHLVDPLKERLGLDQLIGQRFISDDALTWYAMSTLPTLVGVDQCQDYLGMILGPGNAFPLETIELVTSKTQRLRYDGYIAWSWLRKTDSLQVLDLVQEIAPLWGFDLVQQDHQHQVLVLRSTTERLRFVDEPLGPWLCRSLASIITGGLPLVTLTGDWVQTMNYDAITRIKMTYAVRRCLTTMAGRKGKEYLVFVINEARVNDDLSITVELGTLGEVKEFLDLLRQTLKDAPNWLTLPVEPGTAMIVLQKINDRYPSLSPMTIDLDWQEEGKTRSAGGTLIVDVDAEANESSAVAHPALLVASDINTVFIDRPDQPPSQVDVIRSLTTVTGMDRERFRARYQGDSVDSTLTSSPGLVSTDDPQLDVYFESDPEFEEGAIVFADMVYRDGSVRSLVEVPVAATESSTAQSVIDTVISDWEQGKYFNPWSRVMTSNSGTSSKQPSYTP